MIPNLALIDYGSGNLRSVTKALEAVGASVQRVSAGPLPEEVQAVVLPGVGSFGDSATQLRARGLFEPIREWIISGRRFLGICLGYQLLFERSAESEGIAGLGIFSGTVRRFDPAQVKVPHIGWNEVRWSSNARSHFPGLPPDGHVYFVHSYFPVPDDRTLIAATTDYQGDFAAAISTPSLLGVQFHPEKSQDTGLSILRQFVSSLL